MLRIRIRADLLNGLSKSIVRETGRGEFNEFVPVCVDMGLCLLVDVFRLVFRFAPCRRELLRIRVKVDLISLAKFLQEASPKVFQAELCYENSKEATRWPKRMRNRK